ncbi:MAG: NADH-quinone oxidoreductase subunit NuoK [Planctomycetes bacterium]|nr:NADH-quinone oxidoreductase subunit NuoK [Planctomycetota bacterium]
MNVPNEHMLYLAAALFAIGVLGFVVRRNVIVVLMSIELMLNAANLTFLAGARAHGGPDVSGPVFALFVIVIAAVEAAVGLALVIALFRLKRTVESDALVEMKG